jgi:hypothetical protein
MPFLRPAVANGGQLTFTTSRGGTSLQVGDTWTVSISGATPKAPVTVSGSMPSGAFSSTAMGSTDANGTFSKSGTVDAGMIGAWQESWMVGGEPSGSLAFSVSLQSDRCPVCGALPAAAGVVWLRVSNADGTIDYGGEMLVVVCPICRVHYSPLAPPC